MKINSIRELDIAEQSSLIAGNGQTICDCGNVCECYCKGKELPAKSTSLGNSNNVKSRNKQFHG